MNKPSTPGGTWPLYLTVTLSGAAVMILELLGTRIIGPFYGVSLYVWSALIAVTLIALALGYYLGGHIADRHPGFRLEHVLLAGALATVAIPYADGPVLAFTDPLGIRVGAFASALLLFTPSLTLLAMVGPYAIKRATRDLDRVGAAVGSVYAVSTLGSVAGTLLLGFYLLPRFGTRAILFSLGVALVAWALLLAWTGRRERAVAGASGWVWLVGLAVGLLSVAGYAQPLRQTPGFGLLHEAESIYGWVRVVEDENNGYRLLLSDSSVLSAVETKTGRSLLNYQTFFRWIPLFRPEARHALLIGLGGGHVARDLNAAGITTDTIEIDPEVAQAARDYFGFQPVGKFIVGDARFEIKRLGDQRYDFIMHDCFTGGSEPTHLLSREMLGELRGLLGEGGVLAVNYVGFRSGEGSEAVASVYRTLKTLFPQIRVFTTEKEDFTDFIFLASDRPLEVDTHSQDRRIQILLEHEYRVPETPPGIVITDDYNPMESLQVRKAETYRKVFMERIAYDLLLR
ncbi:hypothetical protein SAMN02949497_2267 [Methylomagnum ishizawai]|uniref:Spermidine synthase n=1 Tax=Methylomagnum ishizawai TaxID=1760988 RepID=A0A1Y6CW91_9GAMM|nr:fused MFS/spermidine synthase [Methylomagnum ishizawai]SMF94928.1 hypothetical protein SAMN02949497_2267 [Methylomagnum ishizawai]